MNPKALDNKTCSGGLCNRNKEIICTLLFIVALLSSAVVKAQCGGALGDPVINAMLEAGTDYEIRVYRPRQPVQIVPLSTQGMQPGEAIRKEICY